MRSPSPKLLEQNGLELCLELYSTYFTSSMSLIQVPVPSPQKKENIFQVITHEKMQTLTTTKYNYISIRTDKSEYAKTCIVPMPYAVKDVEKQDSCS
jgi:hypothetical protein